MGKNKMERWLLVFSWQIDSYSSRLKSFKLLKPLSRDPVFPTYYLLLPSSHKCRYVNVCVYMHACVFMRVCICVLHSYILFQCYRSQDIGATLLGPITFSFPGHTPCPCPLPAIWQISNYDLCDHNQLSCLQCCLCPRYHTWYFTWLLFNH